MSSSSSLSSWWCLLFYFSLRIIAVVAPLPCPSNDAVIGYTTISEINHDMTTEVTAIQGGAAPNPPYIFVLCPNTTFAVASNEPLRMLLNDSYVICGSQGAVTDLCIIEGGATQVSIQDSIVPGYALQVVEFRGVTFQGATESSIDASAGSATTAFFLNCLWDSNLGNATIRQIANSTAIQATAIVMSDCSVVNSTSNSIFINQNASLKIVGLTISDSAGQVGILTYADGFTSLQNASVFSSSFPYLAQTGPGSYLMVEDTDVSNLTGVANVFYAQGSHSEMTIATTSIHDIHSTAWSAISLNEGARGYTDLVDIFQNTGLEFGVFVNDGSSANVTNTTIESNSAPVGYITSAVIALNSSDVNVDYSSFINNSAFNTMVFVGFQSNGLVYNSLFEGGATTFVVFVDQDSTIGANNNVYDNITSVSCSPPLQRIFVENNGSHCFFRTQTGGLCTGKCGVVTSPTQAPSALVTTAPTVSTLQPTVAPTAFTLAPTQQTRAPTLAPTFITPAPTLQTGAPSVAPTVATSAPSQVTLAPFAPVAPTLVPTTPTKAPPSAPPSAAQYPTVAPVTPTSATLAPTEVVYTSPAPSSTGKVPKAEKFKKKKTDVKGSEKLFKGAEKNKIYPKQKKEAPTIEGSKTTKEISVKGSQKVVKLSKQANTVASNQKQESSTVKSLNSAKRTKLSKETKGASTVQMDNASKAAEVKVRNSKS